MSSVSTVQPDVSLEDGEIAMSDESSEAGASPSVLPVPVPVPVSIVSSARPSASSRRSQSSDYKRLVRLVLSKVKLGSDLSTVKKQCSSLAKIHKITVSDEECVSIASSVCSPAPVPRIPVGPALTSVPDPVTDPVPDPVPDSVDPVPDPPDDTVPAASSEEIGDWSSVTPDHPDPILPAPVPARQ